MDAERWRRLDGALQRAFAAPEDEREAAIGEACGGDATLQAEVGSLLESERAPGLLDRSVPEMAAEILDVADWPAIDRVLADRYHVLRHLGAGGVGDVYLAEDLRLGRRVALKFLPPVLTAGVGRLHRFDQEARAASALNHPNILTVYDAGTIDGRPYIAAEFVEGETLRSRMTTPLRPRDAVQIAVQVVDALAATHRAGIVHRDIKPENLMVRADGLVKILDFGLAQLPSIVETPAGRCDSSGGMVLGTTSYMSPEQARGLSLDGRSDLYSVGVVLFEMITGRRPFQGATPSATIASIIRDQPPTIADTGVEVAAALERLVARSLHKNAGDRYQRAEDLSAALLDVLGDRDHGIRASGGGRTQGVRRRAVTIGSLAVVVSLLTASALWTRQSTGDPGRAAIMATHSAEAHRMYVKGRYFWNKRTIAGLETAIAYFVQASNLDPTFAQSYAGLADAYISLAGNPAAPRPPRDYLSKAKQAALKAIALAPNASDGHVALATVRHFLDWDWHGAERDFTRALALDAGSANAYQRYGIYLAFMRRFEESIPALQRAETLDPVSLAIATDLAVVYNFGRRPDLAIPQVQKALEIDPTYGRARFELAAALALQGRHAAAADELDKLPTGVSLPNANARVARDRYNALAGRPTNTPQLLADLIAESRDRYVQPTTIAELQAALGHDDDAFLALEMAFNERSIGFLRVFVDPRWERYSIYVDPRFAALRQRVGLPDDASRRTRPADLVNSLLRYLPR